MLVFTDHEAIRGDAAELISLGYGYSIVSAPSCDERRSRIIPRNVRRLEDVGKP
jgi:hypothetical protein